MTLGDKLEKCRREVEDLRRRKDALDERFTDPEGPSSRFDASVERFRQAAKKASRGGDATMRRRLVGAWDKAREHLTAQLCLLEARHFLSSALHLAHSADLVGAQNQLASAVADFTEAREILSSKDRGVARVKEELEKTARDVRQETEQMITHLEHALERTERLVEEFDRAA